MGSTGDLTELVRLDKCDAKRAADTLGRAFAGYQMIRHYFPIELDAIAIAKHFLLVGVTSGLRVGEVYATSSLLEGVAVWIPPGSYPVSTLRRFLTSPFLPLVRFLFRGGLSMMAVGDFFDRRHKVLMQRPHWYLEILGVDPKYQGKGYSSRLVRAMYPRADTQSVPIYIETIGSENAAIYNHLGFSTVEESLVPSTPLTYFCLVREPESI